MKRVQDNEIAYCGVSTDGSNYGSVKIFPIIIQYFDWKTGGMQSKLIELDQQPNETADTISSFLRNAPESKGLLDKCIAFTGDNCNTMFGGLRRDAEGKNVSTKLKKFLGNKTLIGVGCPAHILNNCVHQAVDTLDFNIEGIIFKLYQYFNIYTVRTEQLKEFSEFVDVEYKNLLSHSKRRWLSLLPGITRLIHMLPALKSFFLSQPKPPTVIKKFFEIEYSEIYLYHLKTLVGMFHSRTEELERETNSLVEVLGILLSIKYMLPEHKASEFMSIKVKILLEERRKNGLDAE